MKKAFVAIALGIFLAMTVGSVYALEVFKSPTEVIRYDASKAFNGYTMFSPFSVPSGDTLTTYLIDMQGNVVHAWEGFEYSPGLYAYLMEDGNIMRAERRPEAVAADTYKVLSGPSCGRVEEYDWDGNLVWTIDHYSADSISHHDFQRIWNTKLGAYTTIFLTFERLTAEDAVALGADPIYEADYIGQNVAKPEIGWSLDGIYEVDMDKNIIWKWSFADHLCQDYDPTKPNFGVISEMPGKLDINYLLYVAEKDGETARAFHAALKGGWYLESWEAEGTERYINNPNTDLIIDREREAAKVTHTREEWEAEFGGDYDEHDIKIEVCPVCGFVKTLTDYCDCGHVQDKSKWIYSDEMCAMLSSENTTREMLTNHPLSEYWQEMCQKIFPILWEELEEMVRNAEQKEIPDLFTSKAEKIPDLVTV